ncbi:MAG: hypothetical protein MJ087_00325 [Lachnospiraceae bacterium]|nr:hypothetical protein [Lachnospiraceae bacterium]
MFEMWKLEEGKLSVEAAFLMPMIFYVLVLILYFFFYGYESGLAAGLLQEELCKTSPVIKNQADYENGDFSVEKLNKRSIAYLLHPDTAKAVEACMKAMKQKMAVRSVFGQNVKVFVKAGNGKITGTITADLPFFSVMQKKTVKIRMPAEELRRWQQLE